MRQKFSQNLPKLHAIAICYVVVDTKALLTIVVNIHFDAVNLQIDRGLGFELTIAAVGKRHRNNPAQGVLRRCKVKVVPDGAINGKDVGRWAAIIVR